MPSPRRRVFRPRFISLVKHVLGPCPAGVEGDAIGGEDRAAQQGAWSSDEPEIDAVAAAQSAEAFLRVVADITVAVARRRAVAKRALLSTDCVATSPESDRE